MEAILSNREPAYADDAPCVCGHPYGEHDYYGSEKAACYAVLNSRHTFCACLEFRLAAMEIPK